MDYNFDLLDRVKALSDAGKLDLAQYEGKTVADLELPDYKNIHYSVTSSKRMPADAYELTCVGRDLGDKGTRLFENSLMLAVAYVNGRLRVVDDGDEADNAAGRAGGTQVADGTDSQGMSDRLQEIVGRLDTFETVTRRLDGKVSNIQQTLNSEVKRAGRAPSSGDGDDGQDGTPVRIAIDMHDDDTVVHDVATILEKVSALQGMLEKCADGISENASGTASCIRGIRSCSDSIDSLLDMLVADADAGADAEVIDEDIDDDPDGSSGLGDATDDPNADANDDAMPTTAPQGDDAAGMHDDADDGAGAPDVTDAGAADVPDDDDIAALLNSDDGDDDDDALAGLLAADDEDVTPSDDDAMPMDGHEADDAKATPDVDGGEVDEELYAMPIDAASDAQSSSVTAPGASGFGIIDGHLDSMDDIANRFDAQVRESLGFKPGVPSYDASVGADAAAVGDDVMQVFDNDDDGYVDLFGDGAADDDARQVAASDGASVLDDAIGDMDMSDFMSDMAGDDEPADGEAVGRDDGAGSGLDAFPDVSGMFDDADDAYGFDADNDGTGDADADADADVVDVGDGDDGIVVPVRRRRGSRAKWNA